MSGVSSARIHVLSVIGGLLVLSACGAPPRPAATTPHIPGSWRTVSFDAGSFSVPPDWLPGDPAAWCGADPARAPRYSVPEDGGSISIGCGNPQTWYGATVRPSAPPVTREGAPIRYEALDGQHTYPTHAWVVSAPVGDNYTLTVVAVSRETATMVVDSLRVTT
jgi:hypothetical protein